ncbi:hypothetical protein BKA69DRAFT_1039235 [Paraphysoderma sedebokerense]|nr:hypothetical protein BKA69DRAFT_1039235 [Paraphysoderma sedebokerense]
MLLPYCILPTLLLLPIALTFFTQRLGPIIPASYSYSVLGFFFIRHVFRFLWTFSICYGLFLLNLGMPHMPTQRKFRETALNAVEIVQCFRDDKERSSIVEKFLRQIHYRIGGANGTIFNRSDNQYVPICEFSIDVATENVKIAFDLQTGSVEDGRIPTTVLNMALERKETFLMSLNDCVDEEIGLSWEPSRIKAGGSIICVPIIESGNVTTIVYMEWLFSDLSQMNRSLDRKVADRTMELEKQKVELEEAKCKAEASAQSKAIFLANMSHEVRTPASQIIGASEMLGYTKLTSEQLDFVNIIQTSGKQLLHLLNDILDLSKLNSQKLKLDLAEFDLRQTLVTSMESFTVTKPLRLAYFMDHQMPTVVIGDVIRIQQILTNLISNAIKFTRSGYVLLQTETVLVDCTGDVNVFDVQISITDSGTGISPEKLDVIFQRFEQENTKISREHGGTGLGLSICTDLCTLMGSKLAVKSQLGEGSTFYFTLRLQCPKIHKIQVQSIQPAFNNTRVLLLTNSKDYVPGTTKPVLQMQLEMCQVVLTVEELDYINSLEEETYDLVIIDASSSPKHQLDQFSCIQTCSSPAVIIHTADQRMHFVALNLPTSVTMLRHPYKQSSIIQLLNDNVASSLEVTRHKLKRQVSDRFSLFTGNLKILLVEDNEVNQKVIQALFKKLRHSIDIAENGLIATEKAKQISYDFIFMDVRMPVMDGLEATGLIKAHYSGSGRKAPIIIGLSSDALSENRDAGIEAGMDDYLTKPVSKTKLAEVLEMYSTNN